MNYAEQKLRAAKAEIDWNLITISYCPQPPSKLRDWCNAHKSNGEYFYFWSIGDIPQELWYFELEKDALLFALMWGT